MRAKTDSPADRAFTLIELLTVIAIIGILASILIPVVGQVREQAKVAQCTVHLRDLGNGVAMYANDHEDMIPPFLRSTSGVLGPESEWGSLVDAHGAPGLLLAPEKGGPNFPGWSGDYLDDAMPLFCPSTRPEIYADPDYKKPETINRNNRIVRMGYMYVYRNDSRRDNSNLAVDNLNRPYVYDFPAPGTSALQQRFTYNPHQNRVNVLHIGGHVTSFTTDELLRVASDPGGNTLFDYFTFKNYDTRH